MEKILKYTRAIPLALLYLYYRFLKDAVIASILKLGTLLLVLLISLNIFIYVKYHTPTNRTTRIMSYVLGFLIIGIITIFFIHLFKNWENSSFT
ncbi:hypothetical protein ACFO3O_18335 [Dokdonia ponticola]|uniref:Uncharacterized protein n=1 Tax=Dokdonia ponticola TaxID=2041041 RepID=A0ABV9I2F4_9FLAO